MKKKVLILSVLLTISSIVLLHSCVKRETKKCRCVTYLHDTEYSSYIVQDCDGCPEVEPAPQFTTRCECD